MVCSKLDQNRTISGWVIHDFANFCPRYVLLWPWPLPLELVLLWYFGRHVPKLCTKFDWNRTIRGRVIDHLAHFRCSVLGGGVLSPDCSLRCGDRTSANWLIDVQIGENVAGAEVRAALTFLWVCHLSQCSCRWLFCLGIGIMERTVLLTALAECVWHNSKRNSRTNTHIDKCVKRTWNRDSGRPL